MKLSVILISKNNAKTLEQCLRAIEGQFNDKNSWELILVDCNSGDGSWHKAKDFLKRSAEYAYQLIYHPNKNTAEGANTALSYARGKFVFLIDADAIVGKGYLKNALAVLEQKPYVEAVGGKLIYQSIEGLDIYIKAYEVVADFHQPRSIELASEDEASNPAYPVYRRSVFDKLGYLNREVSYFTNLELHHRMIQKGLKIWYHPQLKAEKRLPDDKSEFVKHVFALFHEVPLLRKLGVNRYYKAKLINPLIWLSLGLVLLILSFFVGFIKWLLLLFILFWMFRLFMGLKNYITGGSDEQASRLQLLYLLAFFQMIQVAGILSGIFSGKK